MSTRWAEVLLVHDERPRHRGAQVHLPGGRGADVRWPSQHANERQYCRGAQGRALGRLRQAFQGLGAGRGRRPTRP
eukprot:3329684-Pleurochrysis_carterae.AAC.2